MVVEKLFHGIRKLIIVDVVIAAVVVETVKIVVEVVEVVLW